ncbi:phosphonoacetaldehyde reductase [Ponticoccus sp. SC2-23]|uniref:iron-containing alcohol dehydrogenase PsrA n=1 Tax=Alexandriicola marinus TaxID=2081710 RepID=UPI000FD7F696|nr:iron-containing alcohol dehydrogenase PsrA [Alexandriicola marinus]MBM1218689.1 phosphonoacetaldehyde reductase [Ponticoccus sp. SC6-9]MBM1224239.1 phosphonoacetaldehyde reductase [Ponticoccus sp. SC6-15]MBM1229982.1 phosphonoacetaldehyde reductase [Ponticoccus sp. SC6-38]MBM1233205.1 phosphonoacetaldehyde reductase [Ponticoccus sp. SC6-45]MBM1236845.1 phosphonoacetaldehyde reductase [Ponticoccus sp. SC6-49]MBM1242216.1 phosphonoacetaldehyde reductase [Ponticoccus sp. SC2-64]MBM1246729.1 
MTAPWRFRNPVDIHFDVNAIETTATLLNGARYAIVTYPSPMFQDLAARLEAAAGPAGLVIDDVLPNPERQRLSAQCARFWPGAEQVDVIVAIGGGSVIDTAKVLAAGRAGFDAVMDFVTTGRGGPDLRPVPLLAIPTTAGTGSEVTCWATIWDEAGGAKFSLAHEDLYPKAAIIDPSLMLRMPADLTQATGLDTLSHALESLWNKNVNPVSARHAVDAALMIRDTLGQVLDRPDDLALRTRMSEAAVTAGLAFSNTKTAIAHNLSYPVTLDYGVAHGIACSFTLPHILRSVAEIDGICQQALMRVFGSDLMRGADDLTAELNGLGVPTSFADYGIADSPATRIIAEAFEGQRGRNFIGDKDRFLNMARSHGLLSDPAGT